MGSVVHVIRRVFIQSGVLSLIGAALLLLIALPSAAMAENRLLIVLSEKYRAYSEVATAIQTALSEKKSPLVVNVIDVSEISNGGLPTPSPNLVVAVGVRAAKAVASLEGHPPVLNLLLPRQSFERLVRSSGKSESRSYSAIYFDQPYGRQFDLIRQILPGREQVGVLFGESTKETMAYLANPARQAHFQLRMKGISSQDELIPFLKALLAESDVLLAVPDPAVFNSTNIQGILLTTYRYDDPVVAFSPAYVKAGALAAVYSTPSQIGTEAGGVIQKALSGKKIILPPPQYPNEFSVSINYQVARSLGIAIESEAAVYEKLKRSSEQKP